MSPLWHPCFVFILIVLTHRITNTQPEEPFYFFNFEQPSDWIENNGTFDPTQHTYVPILWPTGDPNCPRASEGEKSCVWISKDAFLSRTIPTIGFHSIRLQIDAYARGVETVNGDWCILQYRTATIDWQNVNVIQGLSHWNLGFSVRIPDMAGYNNQSSFQVKVGINANAGGDNCYFDNLQLFGIPYTQNPTKEPSQFPSKYPTIATNIPTTTPTANPSRFPSVHPSIHPSDNPSNAPITVHPTAVPKVLLTTDMESTTKDRTMPHINANETNTHIWILVAEIGGCCLVLCTICVVVRALRRDKVKEKQFVIEVESNPVVVSNIVVSNNSKQLEDVQLSEANNSNVMRVESHSVEQEVAKSMSTKGDNALEMAEDEFIVSDDDDSLELMDIEMDENEEVHPVRYWLQNVVQLPQYYDCFVNNGYERLQFVKDIRNAVDLENIGIVSIQHQEKLLREIVELQNNPDAVAGDMRTEEGD